MQHSAYEGQHRLHWYADVRYILRVLNSQKRHSSFFPNSGNGKEGHVWSVCGVVASLIFYFCSFKTGQMYKDSLDKQASCLFLILPLCFLFPVFFAQVEVEADIYLKSAEPIVQGEIVAMIVIVLSDE